MTNLNRIKNNSYLRELADSGSLSFKKMIQPLFVVEGLANREELPSLLGTFRDTEKTILKQMEEDMKHGINHFLLFTVPKQKSDTEFPTDFFSRCIQTIKSEFPSCFLWLDTCLCSLTTHGHCGHVDADGVIDNDKSVKTLSMLALQYAEAGADGIAPSDMMDGRVFSHRQILDSNGFRHIPIMSYSTKFKSNLYGPFRGAADSSPKFGDRSTYQLDIRDRETAIRSSVRDAQEGADLLMLKPGITSLDLIHEIKIQTKLPVGAYQVSGEYASINLLSANGFLKREDGLIETWQVFRRAGVSFLITYAAREAQRLFI